MTAANRALFSRLPPCWVGAWLLAVLLLGCGERERELDRERRHGQGPKGRWHAPSPRRFVDVTRAAGIDYEHAPNYLICGNCVPAQVMTGGAAAADYDTDGLTDLFVSRLDGPDLLYRNMGDGTFEDVSRDVGLDSPSRSNAAVWGDVDNDGDLDLFVTIVELMPEELGQGHFQLYINDAGQFTDQAIERGVAREAAQVHRGWSAAFGDYDRDGYLDLHTTEWVPRTAVPGGVIDFNSRLFRNLGSTRPGYFEDTTLEAGVDQSNVHPDGVYSFTSAFTDLDADGWPDLAVAADFGASRLFWNNGDGSFVDGTEAAGVGTDENGMGSALGDWDMDGDIDWFVSSISCSEPCPAASPETGVGVSGNRLYENLGGRRFLDATDAANVRQGYWGWGAQFFDYDNDRDLDLIMTNGYTYPAETYEEFYTDPMLFWENDGTGSMSRRGETVGVTGSASGKGLLVFDYDNDGDQDVFVVNNSGDNQLLRNDGGSGHAWLRLRLRGTTSNRDAVGARVIVEMEGERPLLRELRAGGQFLGQNESTLHFGLGPDVDSVDRLRVLWPSGLEQTWEDVAPNQLLEIVEGE